jgi:hypothetical protein
MHDILPITQESFEGKISHRLPPLNGLRSFEAAARRLSFTRAADELSVTPGAVSQQVRSLERALGITLFRRLPRSLILTDEGEAYLPAIVRAGRKFLNRINLIWAVQSLCKNISVFVPPKSDLELWPSQRGVSRSSRT